MACFTVSHDLVNDPDIGWAGAWSSVPGNTLGAVQGYVSVFPLGAGESVVAADQSGWVYSVNPATGAINWLVKLNADAVHAAARTCASSSTAR